MLIMCILCVSVFLVSGCTEPETATVKCSAPNTLFGEELEKALEPTRDVGFMKADGSAEKWPSESQNILYGSPMLQMTHFDNAEDLETYKEQFFADIVEMDVTYFREHIEGGEIIAYTDVNPEIDIVIANGFLDSGILIYPISIDNTQFEHIEEIRSIIANNCV